MIKHAQDYYQVTCLSKEQVSCSLLKVRSRKEEKDDVWVKVERTARDSNNMNLCHKSEKKNEQTNAISKILVDSNITFTRISMGLCIDGVL